MLRGQLTFELPDPLSLTLARCLLFAEQQREGLEFDFERGPRALLVAQARIELAFAQRQDVRTDLHGLLLDFQFPPHGAQLLSRSVPTLIQGLQPQRLAHVRHGLRQSVQGGRTRIEAAGEARPPRIEHRPNRVGRATPDFGPNLLHRWALACAKQGVGRVADIALGHAAAAAIGFGVVGHFRSVLFAAAHIFNTEVYIKTHDN